MNLSKCRTTLQIDLDAISHNLELIQNKCRVPLLFVIKADAYGHGAAEIARHVKDKCAFFGVAYIDEALELRRAGIDNPILILGTTPVSRYHDAIVNNVRISVFEYESAEMLSKIASEEQINVPFHIAVDTGMNRIGFKLCAESADICKKIAGLPFIYPEGIFSHFATADSGELSKTYKQKERFDSFISLLEERGVNIPIKHLDNSAGILDFNENYDMARSGIISYGLYPSADIEKTIPNLTPALRWESYISYIKTVPEGEEVSYGGIYKTSKPTKIATIPVGYADGYHWTLSNKFYVLINGKKAPIIGRICMDQLMVDVSEIDDAAKGNKVTLIGRDGDEYISVEEIAAMAGSFNYEFICGISRRVTRIYYENKKPVRYVNYLIDEEK